MTTMTTLATITCQGCGQRHEYQPLILEGRERFKPRFCGVCLSGAEKARLEAEAARRRAELEAAWCRICPPAYRDTDPNFPLMDQRLLAGLMRYEPKGDGRGIGLYGPTGQRKTRMMFLLLRKLHFAGYRVFAISSKRLTRCYSVQWGRDKIAYEAREVVKRCYRAEVLFVDDIGKERFSDTGEAEFFDLVEYRTSHLMPILWTANATGDELAEMMSPDRGGPIVRRLEEFCEVLGVGVDEMK